MGLFCVNFHFRTTDDQALSAALDRQGVTQCRVVPAKGGWTSLYEQRASEQDEARIRDLALDLSDELQVAAIAFLVHDSDIACYWLFENGRLLDEYNSCPNYFDDSAEPGPSGGRPDVLLPFCLAGVSEDDIAALLGEGTVFAEDIIQQLASALGIDPLRALSDYRDISEGDFPEGGGDFDDDGGEDEDDDGDDDAGDDSDDGPSVLPMRTQLASKLTAMFGAGAGSPSADPQAIALVQAAANDDTAEIDRLLAEGVAIDVEAPAPLAGPGPSAGMGLFPGAMPQVAMPPLLAAVSHKRRAAVERLLNSGADPNRIHPLFGTSVHAACGAGDVDVLRLLIDKGGDVNVRNAQGQTPLQVIALGRATIDRLAQAQAMMKSMGMKLPGFAEQLSSISLPTEGWDACERLLHQRGAR